MSRLWGNVKNETFPASLCCLYKLKFLDFLCFSWCSGKNGRQLDQRSHNIQNCMTNTTITLTSKLRLIYGLRPLSNADGDVILIRLHHVVQGKGRTYWTSFMKCRLQNLTLKWTCSHFMLGNGFNAAGLWISLGGNGVRFSAIVRRMWLYARSRVPRLGASLRSANS